MEEKLLYKELSYEIIGVAMEVHNRLGYGFLEKVYENALMILFKREKIRVENQMSIKIEFENQIIGEYIADILVEDKIILELKAVNKILDVHKAQILNYLKATNKKLGIIINFGNPKLEFYRIINVDSKN
jgi:GxxExxY protein